MRCRHVLLDFFGTIVDYVPGRASGVERSGALVRSFGLAVTDAEFAAGMDTTFAVFEKRSDLDDSEFSMTQVCGRSSPDGSAHRSRTSRSGSW